MGKESLFLKRYERKYLLTEENYKKIIELMGDRIIPDKYPTSQISNIYFDTPDYLLIRRSIEGPVYKEKLRLRTYLRPDDKTKAFCEIKKKYKKVVYKRRVSMNYHDALSYMAEGNEPVKVNQITKEIDWMFKIYKGLAPRMYISYDRESYSTNDENSLRLTFDRNITWRTEDLDLKNGSYGNKLLPDDVVLLELKIPGAIPLWITDILSSLKIYPASFSKYGGAYKTMLGSPPNIEAYLKNQRVTL